MQVVQFASCSELQSEFWAAKSFCITKGAGTCGDRTLREDPRLSHT